MYRLLENKSLITLVVLCFFLGSSPVLAFSEFQTYIEQKSKKQLNCAYCHSHVNGPNGNEAGQLGLLSEEQKQLTAYNQFLQGNKELVNSPILNEFGNYLVKKLDYDTIVKAQDDPNKIVEGLKDSDLDRDGINDSEEVLDGTLPNDPLDGNPFKLLLNNIKKNCVGICFQAIAILLLIISLLKLRN